MGFPAQAAEEEAVRTTGVQRAFPLLSTQAAHHITSHHITPQARHPAQVLQQPFTSALNQSCHAEPVEHSHSISWEMLPSYTYKDRVIFADFIPRFWKH